MMFASNAVEVKDTYVPPGGQVQELRNSQSPNNTETASDKKKFSFGWSERDMSPAGALRRKRCLWAFAFCVLITAIALVAASLKKVDSTEFGLQYNIHKKELDDASKSGGLFVGPPGYEFIKFPSTFITVDLDDRTCVSNDGLLVNFSVTFQYQMTEANLLPAVIKYRDFHKWADTVEEAGLSAIHHSCSEFQVTEFQSKRGIIQTKMDENLRLKLEGDEERGLDGVNAVAVSVQLRYIGLPFEYNDAVAEKQAAEEDIALAVAQRKQETTKANTGLLRAKEEARKIMDTAVNEAEVLLTESRLKAEETLFSFEKEADALVQVKESLDLTTEGVLAYLSNMLLSEASNLVVTTGEPAQLSRKDLL
jgi:regulator of protease activity HflC (stomatin/prohibitin superfamily)